MKYYLFIIYFFCLSWSSSAQNTIPPGDTPLNDQLEVKTSLDKSEVTTGDFVLYQIEVTYPSQIHLQSISFPQLSEEIDVEELEPQITQGKPLEENASFIEKYWPFKNTDTSVKTLRQSWRLWFTQEGEWPIPEIIIAGQQNQENETIPPGGNPLFQGTTQAVTVTVYSILDTSNPDQPPLLRIQQSLPPAPTTIPWIWIIVTIVVIMGVGILIFIYYKKKKPLVIEPEEPSHSRALRRLQELGRFMLENPNHIHQYYYKLSEIFREYLENRFDFPAISMTSQEFLPLLEKQTPYTSEERNKILLLTQKSDLIKYAEALPTQNDVTASLNEVVTLVESVAYIVDKEEGSVPQAEIQEVS